MKNKTTQIFIIFLFLGTWGLYARGGELTSQQMKEAFYLDGISIPSPGEIFAAINKVSRPNWAMLSHGGAAPITTNRAQLALAVGLLVTNGCIAVEAQDGQQVKNIGRDIMTLSKALGVSQNILSRGNNLIEFADHSEWDSLRQELEATENEVKNTMIEQQDRNLVTLTSAGAWLRGLEVAAGLIVSNYSPEGAALLDEPVLARHLAVDLEKLSPKVKNDPLVIQVKETLMEIATILEQQNHHLRQEVLSEIQGKASHMIEAIKTAPSTDLLHNSTAAPHCCLTSVLASSSMSMHCGSTLLVSHTTSSVASSARGLTNNAL